MRQWMGGAALALACVAAAAAAQMSKGAGVEKVGIVTEGMRRAAGAAPTGN